MKPERIQIFFRLLLTFLNELLGDEQPESFEFASYAEATAFVDAVGRSAAERRRCPEIVVHYSALPGEATQVLVSFTSVPASDARDRQRLAEAAAAVRRPEVDEGGR
jgi:hypothetical protein